LPLLRYLRKDHGNPLADDKDKESAKRELSLKDLGGDRGAGMFRPLLRDVLASADLHHRGIICPAEGKG